MLIATNFLNQIVLLELVVPLGFADKENKSTPNLWIQVSNNVLLLGA